MTTFRERVDTAIESHQSLDRPEFHEWAQSASPADRDYWCRQLELDAAIALWCGDARGCGDTPTESDRRGRMKRITVMATAVAAGLATALVVPNLWPPTETEATVAATGHALEDSPQFAVSVADTALADASLSGSRPVASDEFLAATETADRLVYAFEPVSDQVRTVVRFLVDSVPGSDVFTM